MKKVIRNLRSIGKLICFLIVMTSLCSPIFAQRGVTVKSKSGKEVILYENSYALIIGNSNYQNGSWGNLPGVKSDVEAVSEILCKHGFNVEIADNLTSKTFETRIKKFINDYGKTPNNRILIYYAGHGFKQKSVGDGREIGYVVPTDAPSPQKIEFVKFAVTMDTIENYAKEIQSKHALFVFDNCFSGKLVSRSPIFVPNEINEKVGGAVRQFMTSGSSEQEVSDQSSFRRAFVRGLKGEADENNDGFTTASELAVFVKGLLYEENNNQSPQYGKINEPNLNLGDFTFGRPTSAPNCARRVSETWEVDPPNSPTSTPTPTPRPTPKPIPEKPKSWIVDSGLFTFELHKCRASGNLVACDFTITNNDVDRKMYWARGYNNRLYDDFNNEVKKSRAEIANDSSFSPEAFLVRGIPTRARLFFEGISPDATKATLIKIFVSAEGTSTFEIQFRNIPLRENVRGFSQIENENVSPTYSYQYAEKKEFRVYPNREMIDSGVDIYPNRKVEVTVNGTLTNKIDNKPIGNILGKIIKQPVNVPPTIQKIGPTSLYAFVKYPSGRTAGQGAVGSNNTLEIKGEEAGRLFFFVDKKYAKSNGYFEVTLRW